MTLNFPTSPSVGVTTSIGEKTWEWNGEGWEFLIVLMETQFWMRPL